MQGYLKRLATSGLAYQASSLVAGFLALFTLPLYTHHLTKAQLGYAETLLTAIILASIVLRFGVGEAFVRFYFDDDDVAHRDRLARRTTSFVLVTSTVAALVAVVFAGRDLAGAAGHARRDAHGLRRARPVGLHQPRDRLRAAARRRAPAHLPDRERQQRACSPSR